MNDLGVKSHAANESDPSKKHVIRRAGKNRDRTQDEDNN
jgi:hypothetical protein